MKMQTVARRNNSGSDRQALALDEGVAAVLQLYKLEPSIIAGSPYADLHANDVGLLVVIRGPEKWNVRGIAQSLGAPISTISSALDRLEKRGLVVRQLRARDRRVLHIESTSAGQQLVAAHCAHQVVT